MFESSKKNISINCKGQLLHFDRPMVMGILNVTPDSFFDGGQYQNEQKALSAAEQHLKDGATFIDIGAYSSRPGAKHISVEEEIKRLSILEKIAKEFPEAYLSIDTFRSEVARYAIEHGACMINDISAGTLDQNMFSTVAELNVPYIGMHMQGTPQTMQTDPVYDDLIQELVYYFSKMVHQLNLLGVNDIIVDPGFGFGKTVAHNYTLLRQLTDFEILEVPILVGLSRKSMLQKVLNCNSEEALNGTTAAHTLALVNGADILRVHDVKEAMEVVKIHSAYRNELA